MMWLIDLVSLMIANCKLWCSLNCNSSRVEKFTERFYLLQQSKNTFAALQTEEELQQQLCWNMNVLKRSLSLSQEITVCSYLRMVDTYITLVNIGLVLQSALQLFSHSYTHSYSTFFLHIYALYICWAFLLLSHTSVNGIQYPRTLWHMDGLGIEPSTFKLMMTILSTVPQPQWFTA